MSRDPIGEIESDRNLYLAMRNNAVNRVDPLGLDVSPPLTAEDDLVGPSDAEMFVDKVYYYRSLSGGWLAIWEIAEVDVSVAVDASLSESLTGTWILPLPWSSNPAEPRYLGAQMKLTVTITDQRWLDCACGSRSSTVGWHQTVCVPGGTPRQDGSTFFYQSGANLSDTPGVENRRPPDLDFVSTLHCRNTARTKLATFTWNVRWVPRPNNKYKGTLSWSQMIQSDTYPGPWK